MLGVALLTVWAVTFAILLCGDSEGSRRPRHSTAAYGATAAAASAGAGCGASGGGGGCGGGGGGGGGCGGGC
ncbi:hypothetical protein HU200_001029 [Digitaria exilis]|uniref:Glycine-rich protein n=1 Tax=Digitaria exilis TaxID=1010633 RepID=A0A835FZP6_9POAL|nr:hypothetical protein HU200_001029 [Digitaria exilis]